MLPSSPRWCFSIRLFSAMQFSTLKKLDDASAEPIMRLGARLEWELAVRARMRSTMRPCLVLPVTGLSATPGLRVLLTAGDAGLASVRGESLCLALPPARMAVLRSGRPTASSRPVALMFAVGKL